MKKIQTYIYTVVLSVMTLGIVSCDDFLDKMPDNRAEVDSELKIQKLLVEAYPDHDYIQVNEMMSDNVDRFMADNPNTSRYIEQVYEWQDVTESNNESSENFWDNSYQAIANANLALEGIENIGGATTATLREAKAEALLCRAYVHFLLANEFCMAYSSKTADKELGLPYIEAPETQLDPKHERGTLAEFYAKIDRDIQEALPIMGGSYYTIPKYHFNNLAAYAFAARFYLYYEKWDKAVEYATMCLGSHPSNVLRDYKELAGFTAYNEHTNHYVDANLSCNLLMHTTYGNLGYVFGNNSNFKKYSHVAYIAENEDMCAKNIWGTGASAYYSRARVYTSNTSDYVIFWRFPREFEYTDLLKTRGYYRSIYPAFTTDECLLNRAEAYILLKQYDKAAADMTLWMRNCVNTTKMLTPDNIVEFYKGKGVEYCYSDEDRLFSNLKKHLHPKFEIDQEGSTQECMLQCLLACRRIECMPMGIRWWDIKRYGIEIPRRTISASGVPVSIEDWLSTDDPRRAIQIPLKVRKAGMEPNPRVK